MASELKGSKELIAKLNQLSVGFQGQVLSAAVRQAMWIAKQEAKARIPVGVDAHQTYKGRLVAPGFAQRSIAVRTSVAKDKSSVTATLGVTPEAFYATQFVELGTAKMPARPWLRPALEASQNRMLQKLVDVMRKRIESIARGKVTAATRAGERKLSQLNNAGERE